MLLHATLLLDLASLLRADQGEIVGGEEAAPHSIPWQVSLQRANGGKPGGSHFCGGSVVGHRHVVTAAHCTVIWDSPDQVEVVAGDHDRTVEEGSEQVVGVTKLTVHENYAKPKQFENDIALWELAAPLEMNAFVSAAVLPEQEQQSEGDCTVSGWGTLHSGGSCCPDKLMKVAVPIVKESTCKLEYPFAIAESMICAGEPGKDSCQGDSGSPFVCYNSDGSGYLGGIVSWGIGCGGLFHPGVYTEVAYFVDWVEPHTPAAPTSPPEPETTTVAETTMPPTTTTPTTTPPTTTPPTTLPPTTTTPPTTMPPTTMPSTEPTTAMPEETTTAEAGTTMY